MSDIDEAYEEAVYRRIVESMDKRLERSAKAFARHRRMHKDPPIKQELPVPILAPILAPMPELQPPPLEPLPVLPQLNFRPIQAPLPQHVIHQRSVFAPIPTLPPRGDDMFDDSTMMAVDLVPRVAAVPVAVAAAVAAAAASPPASSAQFGGNSVAAAAAAPPDWRRAEFPASVQQKMAEIEARPGINNKIMKEALREYKERGLLTAPSRYTNSFLLTSVLAHMELGLPDPWQQERKKTAAADGAQQMPAEESSDSETDDEIDNTPITRIQMRGTEAEERKRTRME